MRKAWISQRVVTPSGERAAAVLAEDGIILDVCNVEQVPPDTQVTDVGQSVLMPGLVDAHVHINEPGRTEWEGFETATRAAAAGGFTTIIDMPLNCLPETTTIAALQAKRTAAKGKCRVDWMPWGGAVNGNLESLKPLATGGVAGFKCFLVHPGCDGFTSIDAANLERAAPILAETGLPLLVHAELQGLIDEATEKLPPLQDPAWRRYATYLASRPDDAEVGAITMLLELCRRYRFRLHIVHLATGAAVDLLCDAKAEGLPLTVETCPHYLHLTAESIPDGATEFKCAPPVRSAANRELLWKALETGVIDVIATDHSPCPPEMKRKGDGRFSVAWGGISSLSTALSVMWTEARTRGHSLRDLARWMSDAPASLAGLRDVSGGLEPGRLASFFVFDPEAERTLTEEDLYYRHKISPYIGERLRGRVLQTVVRGTTVYEDGAFPGQNIGTELRTTCRGTPLAIPSTTP